MPISIKTKKVDKNKGVKLENYEYDIENSKGEVFHVTIKREVRQLPEMKKEV